MNPYAMFALWIIWMASLGFVGTWQNEAGHQAERSAWQSRENEQLTLANKRIIELTTAARKAEQEHAAAMATVSADYQRRMNDANNQRRHDLAAVRAGTLRLRDPDTTGLGTPGCPPAAAGAGAGGRDGAAGGQLSPAASEFLLSLASDADDLARQLAACQGIVAADRRIGLP